MSSISLPRTAQNLQYPSQTGRLTEEIAQGSDREGSPFPLKIQKNKGKTQSLCKSFKKESPAVIFKKQLLFGFLLLDNNKFFKKRMDHKKIQEKYLQIQGKRYIKFKLLFPATAVHLDCRLHLF